jgi:uncharacterized membrane protein
VPPEEIFAYVKELERMPERMPSCKRHEITSEQRYGIRTTTHCIMEQAGRIIERDAVVSEYVENERLAWHCDKPSRNDGIFEFKPTEKGTSVKFIMDYDLPYSILGMLIDKLKVSKEIARGVDEGLAKMKEILEK